MEQETLETLVIETNSTGQTTGVKLKSKDCGGFPDCLFHCLLFGLKSELSAQGIRNVRRLREEIGEILKERLDIGSQIDVWKRDFEEVLKFQQNLQIPNTWNDYIQLIKSNLCGGSIEITAITNLVPDVKIRVITEQVHGFLDFGNSPSPKRTIRLYYKPRSRHYQILLPQGTYHQTSLPALSEEIIERTELYQIATELTDLNRVIVSDVGGAGKTTIATQIGNATVGKYNFDTDLVNALKKKYFDGVIWIEFGKENTSKEFIQLKQMELINMLDASGTHNVNGENVDLSRLIRILSEDKFILVIIDDIWDYSCLNDFLHLNETCGILVTTRLTDDPLHHSFHKTTLSSQNDQTEFSTKFLKRKLQTPASEEEIQLLSKNCANLALLLSISIYSINNKFLTIDQLNKEVSEKREKSPDGNLCSIFLDICISKMTNYESTNIFSALLTLSIFERSSFPHKSTIISYWEHYFNISKQDASELFSLLVASSLISISFTELLQVHDEVYDFLQSKMTGKLRNTYQTALNETYYKIVIKQYNKKHPLTQKTAEVAEWTPELIEEGPQDGYFFLNLFTITGLLRPRVSQHITFAKSMRNQLANPKAIKKLFAYASKNEVDEEKFIEIIQKKKYYPVYYGARPKIYLREVTNWSSPSAEALGLIHFVCLYGTERMLRALLNVGESLDVMAESDTTQRKPLEILIERQQKSMIALVLHHRHYGMLSSCGIAYARANNLPLEEGADWSCITPTQLALLKKDVRLASNLALIKQSPYDIASGGMSTIEWAIQSQQYGFFTPALNNYEMFKNLWFQVPNEKLEQYQNNASLPADVRSVFTILNSQFKKRSEERVRLAGEGKGITIIVKTLTGVEIQAVIYPSDLIIEFKNEICSRQGWNPLSVIAIYKGKQLENHRTFEDYNVQAGDVINVVFKLRGGQ